MKDNLRQDKFGVLLVYPDNRQAALGSPGFKQVFRSLSDNEQAIVDWGWYDKDNERLVEEHRDWKGKYRYIAFSVPFELLYGNVIRILIGLGLEPEKDKRENEDPLIVIGGVAPTINPSTALVIGDIVCTGEIEAHISDVENKVFSNDNSGAVKRLTPMIGISIPMKSHAAPDVIPAEKIDSSLLDNFDNPEHSSFKGAGLVEVGRGCSRGCRFCAAGFIYLPVRHRSVDDVLRDARTYSGKAERIGLVGASLSDHKSLKDIIRGVLDAGFGLTTSSFRADMIDDDMMELLTAGGLKTVTLAPEGGSDRIRKIINKHLTDSCILDAAGACARAGIRNLRLYYMVGLPWEKEEDIEAVISLTAQVWEIFRGAGKKITVSVNPFVPKPQTPFQWCGMAKPGYIKDVYRTLKHGFLKMPGVKFKAMSIRTALKEAVITLGDENVGRALIENVRNNVPWRKALALQGVDMEYTVHRMKPPDELFPWDSLVSKKRKAALLASFYKAKKAANEVEY